MAAGDDVWFEEGFQADLAKSQTAHIFDVFLEGLHSVAVGLDRGVALGFDHGGARSLSHDGGCVFSVFQDDRMGFEGVLDLISVERSRTKVFSREVIFLVVFEESVGRTGNYGVAYFRLWEVGKSRANLRR